MTPDFIIDSWHRTADDLIESTQETLLHDLVIMLSVVDTLDPAEGVKVAKWSMKVLVALMEIELEQKAKGRMVSDGN